MAAVETPAAPYLAGVTRDGEVLAFVCDGDELGEPLSGRTSGSRFELSGNGVRLSGTVQAGVIAGELTVPGAAPTAFVGRLAVEGRSGLYQDGARR